MYIFVIFFILFFLLFLFYLLRSTPKKTLHNGLLIGHNTHSTTDQLDKHLQKIGSHPWVPYCIERWMFSLKPSFHGEWALYSTSNTIMNSFKLVVNGHTNVFCSSSWLMEWYYDIRKVKTMTSGRFFFRGEAEQVEKINIKNNIKYMTKVYMK